jgi:transcriptional regulator with XRE-family HTH domain
MFITDLKEFNMNPKKRKKLKESVKLGVLAKQAGTNQVYLSKIINNHAKPSLELATKLAELANQMTFSKTYKPKDFL